MAFEAKMISILEKLPKISFYARTRGWHFIISWCHRIAGILLVGYIWFHIYNLAFLHTPNVYDAKMHLFRSPFFAFLEWALAIPVIFHALNGGRLILYESFGNRTDESALRWMFGICSVYVALLGLLMLMGNQSISAFFAWITMLITAIGLAYAVALRIWKSEHSFFWKLQRISGAFLLAMVPAHLLFMHLNPAIAKEADMVIVRMQSTFTKTVDLCLLLGALYHGGYGLISVFRDYTSFPIFQRGFIALVTVIMAIFAWVALRLTLTI